MRNTIIYVLILAMLFGALCSCGVADADANLSSDDTSISGDENTSGDEQELVATDAARYNEALTLLEQGSLEDAYAILLTLKDYQDAADYLNRFAFKYERKVSFSSSDPSGSDYYEHDAYGNVTYECHSSSRGSYSYSYEYDENRRLVKKQYAFNSEPRDVCLYEYDAAGNMTEQTHISGDTVQVTRCEFDARGNRTRVVSDALGCIIESQYDDADNLLKMLVKNLDGKVNETYLYEYDSSNRLTREEYQHGTASDVKTYVYDESGRTSSTVSEYNGVVTCRETYEYDENGNLKKQLNDYNTTTTVIIQSYDERGNVIEERKEENGKCLDRVCYEYDANGNCVKKTVEHPTANRSAETVYEYDKWGNLIGCETEESADGISWTHSYVYQNYKLYYDPQSA